MVVDVAQLDLVCVRRRHEHLPGKVNPVGPAQTELIYEFYFCDEKRVDKSSCQEVIAQNLAVIEEDFEICVQTHKNYASNAYVPGPLSHKQEAGVHWFQSKLRDLLVPD